MLRSDPAMKKLLCLLLLLTLLLLCGCVQTAEELPTPEPAAETPEATPCPHVWKDGVCTLCGEACPHVWEDGVCARCGLVCRHAWEGGVCSLCGLVCPHEAHDSRAVCLLCGEQRWHSYESGLCTGCGREPLVYEFLLPEEILKPDAPEGSCLAESFVGADGEEHEIAVWLPADYDESGRYELVICLPGDNCHPSDWTDTVHYVHEQPICLARMYDYLAAERLCSPFIIVGIEAPRRDTGYETMAQYLRSSLLPYLAGRYATWIEGEGEEAVVAAREHIAFVGASWGGNYVIESGLRRCPDLIANFCCMSKGQITLSELNRLETELLRDYGVHCYVGSWGWNEKYAWTWDMRTYNKIVERLDCLEEGRNAFSAPVWEGHNWVTWSTGLFAALQYMF